jgi:hypothetical protein
VPKWGFRVSMVSWVSGWECWVEGVGDLRERREELCSPGSCSQRGKARRNR